MKRSRNKWLMIPAAMLALLILCPPILYLCLIAAVIKALHRSD